MSSTGSELRAHEEWLSLLQPIGRVVTAHALVRKQAIPDHDRALRMQARLRASIGDFPRFAVELLDWQPSDLVGGPQADPLPDDLEVRLADRDDRLRPSFAVRDRNDPSKWLLLIQELDAGTAFDRGGRASPQAKFERMLRELDVPIGLLHDQDALRLVYAPRGEPSGHLTFPIAAMLEAANRPLLAALDLLLGADRLFAQSADRSLPALLTESRSFANEVGTRLAEQVPQALMELLRGFQAADEAAGGELLGEDLQHVHGGLITVLLRLVVLLYAEDRGLLPEVWASADSIVGLFGRLREDDIRHDPLDSRYGAWPKLIRLFRLVFAGRGPTDEGGSIVIPARAGQLFDPDEYPFLEGRGRSGGERLEPPRVSDGAVFRVLRGLLILDGERLSYRALDVEQIGSIYESVIGFDIEKAKGACIGIKPHHVVVDIDELLRVNAADRSQWLGAQANCKVAARVQELLAAATVPADVVAALQRRISARTPTPLPPGSLYLQPSEARRRTGSHYTPRSLTEPIVQTSVRPVLEDLGPAPTEAQILALEVCDPAMGSGAFLIEACRQLADQLKRAWDRHGSDRTIPADEDPLLHARRLVAQHCLYGVDKNPFAVNLAKLSLWLVTLAKDHPFTFLDHALKCGDSLVGLTREQIAEFRWDDQVRAGSPRCEWAAEQDLADARLQGDAVIAAYFGAEKDRAREELREVYWKKVQRWRAGDRSARAELEAVVEALYRTQGVRPFHWEIEFPQVFGAERGMGILVGNPPYSGVVQAAHLENKTYMTYLRMTTPQTGGKTDLVAFFLRRFFRLSKRGGTIGVLATNTAAQGDSRDSGLAYICEHGGWIYSVRRRVRWPGRAAVIAIALHIRNGVGHPAPRLDGLAVGRISAFLMSRGPDRNPGPLQQPGVRLATKGVVPYGMGFVFEDGNPATSSLATMKAILERSPTSASRIHRFLGGADLNSLPDHSPDRFIIDVNDLGEHALVSEWPELAELLQHKARPGREKLSTQSGAAALKSDWWRYGYNAQELRDALAGAARVLACSQTSKYRAFAFCPSHWIFDQKVIVFTNSEYAFFAIVQSSAHVSWSDFIGSTMKDDPVYTPSDCFATFPFPENWQANAALESAGQTYHEFRSARMIRKGEGLTDTYNRFHDPDEHDPDIVKLRDLHAAMDRVVLEAYGWPDLAEGATCEFQLEYDEAPAKRKKKQPWRYEWPRAFHDEVLGRLLELNAVHAEQDRLAGAAATTPGGKGGKKHSRSTR